MSSYFREIEIKLDQNIYPNNNIINRSNNSVESNAFEFSRNYVEDCKVDIVLHPHNIPLKYKVFI